MKARASLPSPTPPPPRRRSSARARERRRRVRRVRRGDQRLRGGRDARVDGETLLGRDARRDVEKEERNRHSASVSSRETEKRHLGSVRFMGELVKFRALDPEWAFDFLKKGVDAFAGRALDAACALLQTCGRYLARRRDTARRTDALLDVFLRRKAVSAALLEPGQSELVDATVLACRPPPVAARRKPSRHPMRAYVAFVVDRLCREWRPPPPPPRRERAARMSRMSRRTRKARPRSVARRRRGAPARAAAAQGAVGRARGTPRRALKGATRLPGGERALGARAAATLDRSRERRADVRDALRGDGGFGRNRREKRAQPAQRRRARPRARRGVRRAFAPATAMFAQPTRLVEENRTTNERPRGSGPNVQPGARRF